MGKMAISSLYLQIYLILFFQLILELYSDTFDETHRIIIIFRKFSYEGYPIWFIYNNFRQAKRKIKSKSGSWTESNKFCQLFKGTVKGNISILFLYIPAFLDLKSFICRNRSQIRIFLHASYEPPNSMP